MKILITGGTGQLGRDCSAILEAKHRVTPVGSRDLDISDSKAVHNLVGKLEPDVILNCAAFTKVDDCESKKGLAMSVNGEGPGNLAAAAGAFRARIIHISTDYVFDGLKPVPEYYSENDEPHPLSYYGVTKLEGEKAVIKATDRYCILRTAWLYGANGHNFLKTMLRLSLQDSNKEIRVVHDQYGSPTWSQSLAKQIECVLDADIDGVFHATSEGYCTWYELARAFLDDMGVPNRVIPCTTREYPTPAKRPANSILENRHLKEKGLNVMVDWRKDLKSFSSLFRDQLINEVS